jgi:hypothetical protein
MVQLLDLSLAGARIEHVEPLPDWSDFPMDLPGALGGGQVRAEVIWSRVSGHRQVIEGRLWLAFQSGLAFPHRTPEEQAALTVALVRIAGEWALGMLRELRRQAEQDRAPGAVRRPVQRDARVAPPGDRGPPVRKISMTSSEEPLMHARRIRTKAPRTGRCGCDSPFGRSARCGPL